MSRTRIEIGPYVIDLPADGDVFSWDPGDGTEMVLDITKAQELAEQRVCGTVCVAEFGSIENHLERYRGLNTEYAMTTHLATPLLLLLYEGKLHLIDGFHRVYRALVEGYEVLPAYCLDAPGDLEAILVAHLPMDKELLAKQYPVTVIHY